MLGSGLFGVFSGAEGDGHFTFRFLTYTVVNPLLPLYFPYSIYFFLNYFFK